MVGIGFQNELKVMSYKTTKKEFVWNTVVSNRLAVTVACCINDVAACDVSGPTLIFVCPPRPTLILIYPLLGTFSFHGSITLEIIKSETYKALAISYVMS